MITWIDIGKFRGELDRLKALDPYELLGVTKENSTAEIKSAYRQKVATYHPDRIDPFIKDHGQEVIKLINTAYERIRTELDHG
jgi:DnaJ-class molecular chaperone